MQIEQFVMAYGVEQDRLRALLPEGFLSLRPVLRINAEIRGGQTGYLELNIRKSPAPQKARQGSPAVRCWEPIRSASSASPEFFRVPSMWKQACRFWKVLL